MKVPWELVYGDDQLLMVLSVKEVMEAFGRWREIKARLEESLKEQK